MARKIKSDEPNAMTFRTEATSFEKGKERPIEIRLFPEYIQIRAVGIQGDYHVPWGAILRQGVAAEVNHRITRGKV